MRFPPSCARTDCPDATKQDRDLASRPKYMLIVHTLGGVIENGKDSNGRTRDRHVSPSSHSSRPRPQRGRGPGTGIRAVRGRGARGLLLLAASATDGGGPRTGHQGPEGLARELLLLSSRRTLPAAH